MARRSHGLRLALGLAVTACGAGELKTAKVAPAPGQLAVFAEGPCPTLSVAAAGPRRFIIYGDHGRDLGGWLPGEHLAAAESLVELLGGRAFRRPELLAGLPSDARGYVRGSIELGGSKDGLWLVRTTTRYSKTRRGPLFERERSGYRYEHGWRPTAAAVTIPAAARRLPNLPLASACGSAFKWVPLTWTGTAAGGMVVVGRCDDDRPANLLRTRMVVAHGPPRGARWTLRELPEVEVLDGIVNADVYAARDDDVYVSVYEPYKTRAQRHAYLAHYDGERWRDLPVDVSDGIMALSGDAQGTVWLAAGRAAYVLRDRQVSRLSLPQLRFVREGEQPRMHVHDLHHLDGELWVEASYRVTLPKQRGSHWASVLYSSRAPEAPLFCDAREPAETALFEAQP